MMEWQPIETAPKDGTPILGWDGNSMTAVRFCRGGGAGWWELVEPGAYADDGFWYPTHWMPLPPPPKDAP